MIFRALRHATDVNLARYHGTNLKQTDVECLLGQGIVFSRHDASCELFQPHSQCVSVLQPALNSGNRRRAAQMCILAMLSLPVASNVMPSVCCSDFSSFLVYLANQDESTIYRQPFGCVFCDRWTTECSIFSRCREGAPTPPRLYKDNYGSYNKPNQACESVFESFPEHDSEVQKD